jgi:DNA-binding transcriptional LysR family regulator
MAIELRHLRYFVVVAEEGHITRAAERLDMQQPPLSQQIKSLEQQVGSQLFHRKARGVQLTATGRAFLVEARKVLAGLDRAIETTRRTARGEQGQLCIGVTPTAPFHPFVPRLIRIFRETHPMVNVTVEEGLSHELLRKLHQEGVDVAFVRSRIADAEGLTITSLLEEPLLVALPAGHPFARGKSIELVRIKSLANDSFVLYGPPGSGIHDATIAACHRAGFTPTIGQIAPRVTSALGLVAAGFGISFVPESMSGLKLDGVSYRRFKAVTPPNAPLNLASRRGDASIVVQHFIDAARSLAAPIKPARKADMAS